MSSGGMKNDNVSTAQTNAVKNHAAEQYEAFPGIKIMYYDIHSCYDESETAELLPCSSFEIFHCREGRMEFNVLGEYCYISSGDILFIRNRRNSGKLYFPLRHYHGITICVDTDNAAECPSCFLHDITVQPDVIAKKICGESAYYIARSNKSFEHIFSELYNVPEEIRHGYCKIKILELLLFLSVFDTDKEKSEKRNVTSYQVSLAKDAAEYLMENMDEKISLEQVADKYHVSVTALKTAFKAVYGVPFYSYIKTLKIESASYMLEHTDKTVIEIANEHGYDNASKFAAAFRSIKEVSPIEYRTIHSRNKRI